MHISTPTSRQSFHIVTNGCVHCNRTVFIKSLCIFCFIFCISFLKLKQFIDCLAIQKANTAVVKC